ncbi:MAG: DMT family transporter [Fuerstiella sp.]
MGSADEASQLLKNEPDLGRTIWPDLSLFGVALIWGINIPVMKNGLDEVDVYVFNAIRLMISVLVLAIFALRERRRDRKRGFRPSGLLKKRRVVIYAVIVSGLYQLVFLLGIARTASANTALIISTIPIWTALLARIFLSEQLSKFAWLGLFTALAGTIVVAVQKGAISVGSEHFVGNLCILAAALLWAVGTVYSRPLLKQISPLQLSASSAAIGLPLHLVVAYGWSTTGFTGFSSVNLWLILIYSGALSTGLALPMWSFGVRHAGAAHAAIIQNLVPFVAVIAAWIFRGELLTVPQLIGGTLIIGGLVIMRSTRTATSAIKPAALKSVPVKPPA